ncbi:MAG TPA: HAD-IIIC family phosphatase [Gemmatirosa sp.]
MKLLEAYRIINAPADPALGTRQYALACGFTPLALESFVHAHLRRRVPTHNVAIASGRFGDLTGNIERAAAERPDGIAVVVEWADIDPRLGLRGHGALATADARADVLASTVAMLDRVAAAIEAAAANTRVAVSGPTLALPPYFLDPVGSMGALRAQLEALLAAWVARLAAVARVRVIDAGALARRSPAAERRDVAEELRTGFPYRREHADALADALAVGLVPPAPMKGLVTDLDDTLWRGLLGEVGVAGVQWGFEHGAHVHTMYQQMLANLAECGVLLAVASKNDPSLVAEALGREDLVLSSDRMYPVHASWGPKSAAIRAVLETWNVGADSVVFVDDSPLELEEVAAAYPDIVCLRFRSDAPAEVLALLERLAELFGREGTGDEDRIRADSIRNAGAVREALGRSATDPDVFLAGLRGEIEVVLVDDASDERAFELVNKTNQFNLNGRRYTTAEWRAAVERPGAFVATATYRDKFGPLGKIAVAAGVVSGDEVRLDAWVLSCRAFARRIEFGMLRALLDASGTDAVVLDLERTPRNGPVAEFLDTLGASMPARGDVRIPRADVDRLAPAVPHAVDVRTPRRVGAA